MIAAVHVDLGRRNVARIRLVELTGDEGVFLGLVVVHWVEVDLVEAHARGVPVLRVFLHDDALVERPFREHERVRYPQMQSGRVQRWLPRSSTAPFFSMAGR